MPNNIECYPSKGYIYYTSRKLSITGSWIFFKYLVLLTNVIFSLRFGSDVMSSFDWTYIYGTIGTHIKVIFIHPNLPGETTEEYGTISWVILTRPQTRASLYKTLFDDFFFFFANSCVKLALNGWASPENVFIFTDTTHICKKRWSWSVKRFMLIIS